MDEHVSDCASHDMKPLNLPRMTAPPKRFDGGAAAHHANTVETHYRKDYYELIDNMVTQLNERYDIDGNNGLKHYKILEDMLLSGDINNFIKVYPEINITELGIQLPMFRHSYPYNSLSEAKQCYRDITPDVRELFPAVFNLLRLLLFFPVSSCESERSFSCLRRLKTWLRSTMTQKRLNHIVLSHVHKDTLDNINMYTMAKQFVV